MATLDKYGYRQYLKDKGLTDEQITYDPNNNAVMAKGKFFANARPEADGSTYDTRGNLDNMYKAYQTSNMPSYKDRTDTLMDQAQQRVTQPMKTYQAPTLQTLQANPAYQTALQAAQQGAATQQGNTLARLRSMGQGKSSYSEGVANQIGQQAVSNVNAQLVPEIMRQDYQKFYDEYQMGRQNTQDLLGVGQAYSNLDQRGLDNAYRQDTFGEQKKQNNLDASFKVGQQLGRVIQPKEDYGNLYNQTDAPLSLQGQQAADQSSQRALQNAWTAAEQIGTVTPELSALTGVPVGTSTLQARQVASSIANASSDNARADAADKRSATSAEQGRLMDIWKATGQAPAGISGVAPGTPYGGDQRSNPALDKELDGLYTGLSTGQIEAGAAIDEINTKLSAGLLKPQEAAQMLALVQNVASRKPVQAAPKLSQDQIDANGGNNPQDLNSNQLERLWATDPTGKAAGAPQIDWAQWYRDPRGKQGGVSFKAWQQAYGPRLGK